MERGNEQTHAFTLYTVTVQVVRHDPGYEVLACSRPAVKGEGQWLIGLWIVNEALNRFQDHWLGQVLTVELYQQIFFQSWALLKNELIILNRTF